MNDVTEQTEQEVIVTTTKPAPASATSNSKPRTKRQPQYTVIVLNDDLHTYDYVIEALSRVCGHSKEQAYGLAKEIDTTGLAAVWMGAMEVAELKRDQILAFGPDNYGKDPVTFPLGVELEPIE